MIIDTRNWSPMSRWQFLWKIIKEIIEDWRADINFQKAVKDINFNKRIEKSIELQKQKGGSKDEKSE